MALLLLSLLLVGETLAAFTVNPVTSQPQGKACGNKNITLRENDKWKLPLTSLKSSQDCVYTFDFPSNCYALVHFYGQGFGERDQMQITDSLGDIIVRFDELVYTHKGAWPTTFSISVHTASSTRLQIQANVTILASRPTANVDPLVSVRKDTASPVKYFSSWPAGKSYRFSGYSGAISMQPVGFTGNLTLDSEFRNVFVYNNGSLVGTLETFLLMKSNMTFRPELLLYAPITPMTRGAVVITDYENVKMFERWNLFYVPYNFIMMTNNYKMYGDDGMETAMTVVGDEDGSNPIDVLSFNTIYNGKGILRVAMGGPTATHSNAMPLDTSNLPKHFPGNMWTFYLSSGSGNVTIHTVSN